MKRDRSSLSAALASLLALALILSGMVAGSAAPQAPDGTNDRANDRSGLALSSVKLEALRLPDGTLPVICFGDADGAGGTGTDHHACEKCCFGAKPKPVALAHSFVDNALGDSTSSRLGALDNWPQQRHLSERYQARAPPVRV